MTRTKGFAAVVLVLVAAVVAAVLVFGGGKHHPHASPVPAVTTSAPTESAVATQPAFGAGVHDAGTVLACLRALPAAVVHVNAPAAHAVASAVHDGLTVNGTDFVASSAGNAGRLAFYAQALRYDSCSGRNFEATAVRNFHGSLTCEAAAVRVQLQQAGVGAWNALAQAERDAYTGGSDEFDHARGYPADAPVGC